MRASGSESDLSRGNLAERRWFVARSCPRAVKKRGRASLIYARRQREDAQQEYQKQRPSRRAIAPRRVSQRALCRLERRGLANKAHEADVVPAAPIDMVRVLRTGGQSCWWRSMRGGHAPLMCSV